MFQYKNYTSLLFSDMSIFSTGYLILILIVLIYRSLYCKLTQILLEAVHK